MTNALIKRYGFKYFIKNKEQKRFLPIKLKTF